MTEHLSIPTPAGSFDAIAAGPEDGRGVLLLHGFPQSSLEWSHQLAELGTHGYRAIAFDQRGYSPGVRPSEVAEYTDEQLCADVLAVADELGWSRFDLVGHDWGAYVAWATAAGSPDRVRTLTAVSVPHPAPFREAVRTDEDQQTRSRYMQTFRQAGVTERAFAENPQAFAALFERAVPHDHVREYLERLAEPGALTAALNWYRAMHLNGPVDPVTVPTMYVWSTEDVAVGSTAALATEHYVTGPYRFEMLEDLTHWLPEQAAERLSALLLEHLAAHRA
ncbi:alpha/beta fold hydrolase [Sciscionella marina]|uniref:alpha/beta fold hydrolase n=1 Tax=Sciscionella marina TaxID=508770 RepID=UPI000373E67D|nr:alpha/beta hydrolase [Sciscionella marina]